MEKSRFILHKLNEIAASKLGRIIVLTGARQVGKTTLVRAALPQYRYISIEDPVNRATYGRLTAAQWHLHFPQAALDEVQKLPSLVESIKATYDTFDDARYLLLGSSQLLLLQKVKESLAGRCTIIEMFPLTLPELRTRGWDDAAGPSMWQQLVSAPTTGCDLLPDFSLDPLMAEKQQAFEHLMQFGGYPALVDESLDYNQRRLWLTNYVRTYLERDVRDLALIRDLEPFSRLQRAVAAQTSQTISIATLSRDVGVSAKTVQRYLEYLNLSYQSLLLPAWDRNPNKRIAKAPKIHFMDHGVLQAVLQKHGGLTGAEFESIVVTEIYKQTKNLLIDAKFHHLRTSDGREVDLLVELPEGYYAFEIKMAHHVQNSDASHLKALQSILDKPILHAFVLSNCMETKVLGSSITAVNAALFLG